MCHKKNFSLIILIMFIIITLLNVGCETKDLDNSQSKNNQVDPVFDNNLIENENDFKEEKEMEEEVCDSDNIDIDSVRPNELGKVMILMYHTISDQESEWSRTYENFRKDLERLYKNGYRLISLNDFINNNIKVEAGYTPAILTFDDGTRGHFNMIKKEDGEYEIDPKSAVGILNDFYEEHPDFGRAATFYINYPVPFRQRDLVEKKLNYLIDFGMEIGNHTYSHANLARVSNEKIIEEIGSHVKETKKYLPEYEVTTLALPYGASNSENYDVIISGEYKGIQYYNKGILLVGAEPALPPTHTNFNSKRLPRIRASQKYLDKWFDYFDNNPELRYTSDGNPDVITIPKEFEDLVDQESLSSNNKKIRLY